ncbi:ASST-domain-containing protein [Xylariaceae sp. FL0804]|nr:ASST-domain-containing protein [Xylariaceae sp. FL0804]
MNLSSCLRLYVATLLMAVPTFAQNSTYWPWQTFKSSAAQPPSLSITKSAPTSPGYLFFDQNGDYGHQYSLFIMSDENELVWQSPAADYSAFRSQMFEGRPVLTFFNGISLPEPWGWGHGIIQILDDSYESIWNVSLTAEQEGFVTIPDLNATELYSYLDMHEARITPEDTILVTAYNVTRFNLSAFGGPEDGWLADSLFYELDIKTNEVLFRWSALAHINQVPIEDVLQFYPIGQNGRDQSLPYGYFHINSVDKFDDGSYLISSRYYCSIFKISKNGTVEWTLQGRVGGDFKLDTNLSFCYQHDARILSRSSHTLQVSIFDNDNSDIVSGIDQTKGLIMTLDTSSMTASLNRTFTDPGDPVYAVSQGNVQQLDDGHVVMGYGSTPKIREYSADGTPVMTAQFGGGDGNVFSYRAYRLPWVGRPRTSPDVFASVDAERDVISVYMSWNGATEHMAWRIFAGDDKSNLKLVAQVGKSGFETVATVPGKAAFVQVEALGPNATLGISHVVAT